jgi:hypothetical protein
MTTRAHFLVFTALVLLIAPPIWAQRAADEIESLRGKSSILVIVETLEPDLEKVVSAQQIKTDVELRLRRAGIAVGKPKRPTSGGALYVRLTSLLDRDCGFVIGIHVAFQQAAVVVSNKVNVVATTWESGGVWVIGTGRITQADGLRSHVADNVDAFINEYLSVNRTSK